MRLGDLERAVLEVLWRNPGGVSARAVVDALPTHPATTTVLTVLDRLTRKSLVTRVKEGRSHRYSATASKETYLATAMSTALDEADDRGAVLSHFVDSVSPRELAVLRGVLAELDVPEPDDGPAG